MKGFSFSSLRAQLVLFAIFLMVPLIILVFYNARELEKTATEMIHNDARHLVRALSEDQTQVVENARYLLSVVSHIPEIQQQEIPKCDSILADLLKDHPIYSNIVIADSSGNIVCSGLAIEGRVNASDKAWFQRVKSSEHLSVGEYQIGRISHEQILVLGYPVRNSAGKVAGFAGVGVKLNWLNTIVREVELEDGAIVSVFDSDGTIMAHYPNPEDHLGKQYFDKSLLRKIRNTVEGSLTWSFGEPPQEYLLSFKQFGPPEMNAYVSIGIPAEDAYAVANSYFVRELTLVLSIGLFTIIVIWIAGNSMFVNKIERLIETAKRVADGDFTARTDIASGSGELNQLAENFDEMALALEMRQKELERSEYRYSQLFESVRDTVFILDTEGKLSALNPAINRYQGYSREEWLNRDPLAAIHPDDRATFQRNVQATLEGDDPPLFQCRVLMDSADAIVMEYTLTPYRENNEIAGVLGIARNVSERHRMQEQLRRREQEFRALVENAQDIITRFNRDFEHMYVNPVVEEITGIPPEEYIGRTNAELGMPNHLVELWHNNIEHVFTTGEKSTAEFTFEQSNARDRYFSIMFVPETDSDGNVETVLGIARDITDLKEVERELEQREEEIRSIVENLPDVVSRVDENYRHLFINSSIEKFIEGSVDDILGKTFREANVPREFAELMEQKVDSVFRTGEEVQMEYEYPVAAGENRLLHLTFHPEFAGDGNVDTTLIISRDVTDLHRTKAALDESEQLLQETFDALEESVIVVDPEARTIVSCNEVTERMFGYSREEIIGKITRILHVDDTHFEKFNQMGLHALQERGVWETEFQMQKKDGTVFPTEHTVSIMSDDEGNWTGVVSVVRDITERKRTEKALRTSRKRLRSLARNLQSAQEEERKRISRDIHDELGQQLTALNMDAIWFRRHLPAGNDTLRNRLEGMVSLIDNAINSVQRISAELHPGMLDDLGLLAVIEWELSRLQQRAEFRYTLDLPQEEPALSREKQVSLYRIFQEGLTNVVRHAEASEVWMTLQEYESEVVLTIQDNGIGIRQEHINNMESLGINSMRERAETWGGEVVFSSGPEHGTTVTARIPAEDELT